MVRLEGEMDGREEGNEWWNEPRKGRERQRVDRGWKEKLNEKERGD